MRKREHFIGLWLAEIVVRKILDIDPQKEITLGDEEIRKSIQKLPDYKIVELYNLQNMYSFEAKILCFLQSI